VGERSDDRVGSLKDTDEMFSLDDAAQLASYARDNGLGLVSYWSIDRDLKRTLVALAPISPHLGFGRVLPTRGAGRAPRTCRARQRW
jgi:hypothetical protein